MRQAVTDRLSLAAFGLAAALVAASPTSAQIGRAVTASDPESIVLALKALGAEARLERDAAGDPLIQAAGDGLDYTVLFYLCEGGADCRVIQFRAGFDLPEGATAEAVAEWNRKALFGTAVRDEEGDPFVQMPLDLRRPVDLDAFAVQHDWWRQVLVGFRRHVAQ